MIPWRLYAAGALVALTLALGGYFAWLQHQNKHLKAEAAVATQQATNNAEAVKQVDHFTHTETIIRERTDDAVRAVETSPSASAPLPDDVRAAWLAGIGSVRAGDAAPDHHHP